MSKMIITSVELVNYIRMSLTGSRILFTPDSAYALQTILGTNGAGKSSFMHMLWPLPANKDDFGVGGRFDFQCTYNGKQYQIISTFENNKPKHEFIVDGIELNDGYKIEMCRALCLEHFGVTEEIRSLALGYEKLTEMSPSRRRYWMIRLADTDFTYAMSAYKKLQDQHRDAQGMIKRLQKRQVDETNKLIDKTVVAQMKEETDEIKKLIQEIYGMRNAQAEKPDAIMTQMAGLDQMLQTACNEVDRLNNSMLENCGYETRDELVEARDAAKLQIHSTQQLSQHLFTDHTRIKKKYDLMIKAGTESIAELEKKVKDAQDEIAFKANYLVFNKITPPSDAQQAKEAFLELQSDLVEALNRLVANDGVFTPERVQKYEESIREIDAEAGPLRARIARLTEDIAHRRSHVQQDSIECPSCHHKWLNQASEEDLVKAEGIVKSLQERLDAIWRIRENRAKHLTEANEYFTNFRAVVMLMRSAPVLSAYFNEITQNNRLKLYPQTIVHDLHSVGSDLDHQIDMQRAAKVITHALEQIALKKNMDADSLESIEKELRHIEETMGIQTQKLRTLQDEVTTFENLIAAYDRNAKLNEQLLNNTQMQSKYARDYIYSRYQELLWYLIMSLQTQLARKEDALNVATQQQYVVDEITHQLEEAHMNERIAKAAHIALSPTNGAIAEGLHRFINVFVTRMNKVVGSVWSYPLELLPFTMEDGTAEMDYKFPFWKERTGKPNKDVAEGSASMLAIFNFAFRMCALRQLGLGHLPLFLDEFEAAFDDTHRQAAIYFVKKLLDEQAFGQIYMVSHYESNHGALSNLAQTCVLSKDNVLLPTNIVYNEHVVIS
ncbi:putative SbcC-ATPase [Burkholderia phage FLC6]|nr:putative SbcC-ATPase [Burkholderia phage FLC6]BDD79346.1 hypothetical protein [Burkholderia phage FLC8]